ncbi:MAG: protein-glutamate O-methyltransferase CheR [Planctomycetes bacterium]|nr:protein-glutamate O-methyltransferase CheR [Planctomycetota bacterium]
MSTALSIQEVTDAQLARYAKLIYERTGIHVSPQKKTLLSNRLRRRLRATGIDSYEIYFKHLQGLAPNDAEWDAFLQEITTHETYLFRDMAQWDWFRDVFLKDIASVARAGKRPKTLRIWSAACSTGDEPHTIACCIADRITDASRWQIEILGTDIGTGAVAHARMAEFGQRAMHLVPDGYRRRFFSKARDETLWSAKEQLRSWTRFELHNLLEPLNEQPFDLVFLKNVLIYFDSQSKQRVIDNIRRVLAPKAYLVTSAAEGVANLLKDMEHLSGWLHRTGKSQSA